jgi:hypothetical protein
MLRKACFSTLLPLALSAPAALAAVSVGCGSLDGHTSAPSTLATVQGTLDNPSSVIVGNDLRIAIVWLDGQAGYSVAEDLPVQPVFPSDFVVKFDGPPPAAAMIVSPNSSFETAAGYVVAYEDLNGDRMLDLVPNDAGQFIDRIVGASSDMVLVYVQGPASGLPSGGPSLGYNIALLLPRDGGDQAVQWLPMSTPYNLTLSTDPSANAIMCRQGAAHGAAGGGSSTPIPVWYIDQRGTPWGGYPAPGMPGLMCEGSTGYTYSGCLTAHDGLCSTTNVCEQWNVALGSASPPAGWPCP